MGGPRRPRFSSSSKCSCLVPLLVSVSLLRMVGPTVIPVGGNTF